MTDVTPRLKQILVCPCGCETVGVPRARAWTDGLPPHSRRCPCKRCQAGRYKKNAARRERNIGKAIGGKRNIGSGAFGGVDTIGGVVAVEETSNQALCAGLKRWWLSKGVQTKTAQIRAQKLVPGAFVASWDGKPQLVVMQWQAFTELVSPLVES